MNINDVGKIFRVTRQKRGWTQAQLAALSGITQGAISNVERGGRFPEAETRAALSKALGIELRLVVACNSEGAADAVGQAAYCAGAEHEGEPAALEA